jgi:hypothetical protein
VSGWSGLGWSPRTPECGRATRVGVRRWHGSGIRMRHLSRRPSASLSVFPLQMNRAEFTLLRLRAAGLKLKLTDIARYRRGSQLLDRPTFSSVFADKHFTWCFAICKKRCQKSLVRHTINKTRRSGYKQDMPK